MPSLPPRLTRNRGRLLVPAACTAQMVFAGWQSRPNETGGVLLGHDHHRTLEVDTVIGPGPAAEHRPTRFRPDSEWQARQVAKAWNADPTLKYLGDWHTHPGGTTRLSALDAATTQAIADSPAAQQSQPVMVVLALNEDLSCRFGAMRLDQHRRMVTIDMEVDPRTQC